ncbi:MAG: complexed with cef1p, partial [Marteilia pararefringens]
VDDYESDDDELLAAELDRIKKERKEQEEQEILQQEKRSERIRKEQIVHGNPLLDSGSLGEKFNDDNSENTFEVKREWNHDVVFMNCSRRQDISGSKKEFINDPLRSEFHSNFMKKYIK